jgi:hypothetical protein
LIVSSWPVRIFRHSATWKLAMMLTIGARTPAVSQVPYAEAFELGADELTRAVELLEGWARAPSWL